jgi:hypothetical protein
MIAWALFVALAIVTLWWQLAEKRARSEYARADAQSRGHIASLSDSLRALAARLDTCEAATRR